MGLVVVGEGGWTYQLDMNRCQRNIIPMCVCVCVCVRARACVRACVRCGRHGESRPKGLVVVGGG